MFYRRPMHIALRLVPLFDRERRIDPDEPTAAARKADGQTNQRSDEWDSAHEAASPDVQPSG
jgi:hypothetical protein